ncbi:MAG: DUF4345 domain-containing protein [Gammaproteobacteria bacterium]|nr:DUF4345 domain-containing protein [Gammaproteobacteria bacterium]MBU1490275.1 DUF4345 domain-containing protein [Gammaproteobacteria bacterium]MBU2065421.1 DUF4345 domain-containing protein [Gammaproteobacteria bacterium]MBU2139096.1 DUF4345 domain-containing protein [Gammaproteobacteria bacterium]MBU2215448.1 DUF4345 domain-containing protein [Gammaproteobacteria bacterium]
MRRARIILAIQMLALGGLGLAYFIQPHEMTNASGMLLMSAAAATDVRAYYGGLQIGLAAFLAMALSREDLVRAALTLLVLLYSALGLARIGGLWLDGGAQQTFNLVALLIEVVSLGLAYWALQGLGRATPR